METKEVQYHFAARQLAALPLNHVAFKRAMLIVLKEAAGQLPPHAISSFGEVDMESLSIEHLELDDTTGCTISGGAILAFIRDDEELLGEAARIARLNFTLQVMTGVLCVRCREIDTD